MPNSFELSLRPYKRYLKFKLNAKRQDLGGVCIEHYWLPIPGLYGSVKKSSNQENHTSICQAFWDLCSVRGSANDRAVRESYLLARITPFVRSIGCQRIFPDARLGYKGRSITQRNSLDELIRTGATKPISEEEFRQQTAKLLGPPEIANEVRVAYGTFCSALLDEPVARLLDAEDDAVVQIEQNWGRSMHTIARRAGNEVEKRVMDILSYEARAAVHRCYSAVWKELLLPVMRLRGLDSTSSRFLEFWNLEPVRPSNQPEMNVHLFHGHIFALHPAGAAFIGTSSGQDLLGQWLLRSRRDLPSGDGWTRLTRTLQSIPERREQARSEEMAYGQLLQGLLLAVYYYDESRIETKQARNRPEVGDMDAINAYEARDAKRRSGRFGRGQAPDYVGFE